MESTRRHPDFRFVNRPLVTAFAGLYLGLLGWWALNSVAGDVTWWLFLINSFSLYLFLPLPGVLMAVAAIRNYTLIGASLAAVAAFFVMWGGLLLPSTENEAEGAVFSVMTYNLLGSNTNVEGVIEALLASDADVIALQELNPETAVAIGQQLIDRTRIRCCDQPMASADLAP